MPGGLAAGDRYAVWRRKQIIEGERLCFFQRYFPAFIQLRVMQENAVAVLGVEIGDAVLVGIFRQVDGVSHQFAVDHPVAFLQVVVATVGVIFHTVCARGVHKVVMGRKEHAGQIRAQRNGCYKEHGQPKRQD